LFLVSDSFSQGDLVFCVLNKPTHLACKILILRRFLIFVIFTENEQAIIHFQFNPFAVVEHTFLHHHLIHFFYFLQVIKQELLTLLFNFILAQNIQGFFFVCHVESHETRLDKFIE
jgi:hypothetical protein